MCNFTLCGRVQEKLIEICNQLYKKNIGFIIKNIFNLSIFLRIIQI